MIAGRGKAIRAHRPRLAPSTALCVVLRTGLEERADPGKASGMRAYMKSEMPYAGVQTPALRALCREVFVAHPLGNQAQWLDTVLALWRRARYREERYAAITLAGFRTYRDFRTLKALPTYEEMVVDGAWWDYVDAIAVRLVGDLLSRHPGGMRRRMRTWARGPDLWKRRSAILCQLKFKDATDIDLLHTCIEHSIEEREFFLRKAIGWALREHAKTDPDGVVDYVVANAHRLSALSKREALRNLVKAGRIDAVP